MPSVDPFQYDRIQSDINDLIKKYGQQDCLNRFRTNLNKFCDDNSNKTIAPATLTMMHNYLECLKYNELEKADAILETFIKDYPGPLRISTTKKMGSLLLEFLAVVSICVISVILIATPIAIFLFPIIFAVLFDAIYAVYLALTLLPALYVSTYVPDALSKMSKVEISTDTYGSHHANDATSITAIISPVGSFFKLSQASSIMKKTASKELTVGEAATMAITEDVKSAHEEVLLSGEEVTTRTTHEHPTRVSTHSVFAAPPQETHGSMTITEASTMRL